MKNREQGFSLIELLVVVSLLGLVMAGATGLFLTSLKTSQKTDVAVKMKQDGYYALNFMRTTIRNAQEVVCHVSDVDVTDSDGNLTTFEVSADRLVASNTSGNKYLTSNEFIVSGLVFTCSEPEPKKVSLGFTLTRSGSPETQDFQTTVSLRSY